MKGIYLLQMDDDEPADDELPAADPSISLNAITGLALTDTMQLNVKVADQTLGALIDSGSTHLFISASVAARLHLYPLHQPELHIKVANGDQVASAGMCHATHIFIDAEEFVIPLEGFNMVLGVQ
jgi:hypothetical protein